jgi:hypothetical protein
VTAATITPAAPAAEPACCSAWLPARELSRVLGNAVLFAGAHPALPELEAVRLCAAGDTLTVSATDRYALLRETAPLDGPAGPFDVSVPAPAVRQVRQLLAAAPRGGAAEVSVLPGRATPGCLPCPRVRVAAGGLALESEGWESGMPVDGLLGRADARMAEHGPRPFDVAVSPRLLGKLRPATEDGAAPARLSRPADPDPACCPAVQVAVGDRIRVLIMPVWLPREGG